MSEVKLKMCPFCKSADIDPEGWMSSDQEGGNIRQGPACNNCGASADTVDLWNTRPTEDALYTVAERMAAAKTIPELNIAKREFCDLAAQMKGGE